MPHLRLLEWLKNKLTVAPRRHNITLHLRVCGPFAPGGHLELERMQTVERYVDMSNQHLLEATILMLLVSRARNNMDIRPWLELGGFTYAGEMTRSQISRMLKCHHQVQVNIAVHDGTYKLIFF